MGNSRCTVYLADANVLLNLSQLGRLDLLQKCVARLGWRLIVPRCVLREVEGEICGQDLVVMGVEMSEDETSISMLIAAERTSGGISSRLSDVDVELYIRAKRDGACVWTDDGRLVDLLRHRGLVCHRMFTPLLELCKLGEIEPDEVISLGQQLREVNCRFTEENLSDLIRKTHWVREG